MKKTFNLTHPKIKSARLADKARSDVKKYLKRELQKELPEGSSFWEFDCKFGPTAEKAKSLHVADIGKAIDQAEEQQLGSFYVEIIARAATAN
ncbi:MAG: DUF6172 family protein [Mariprofundus sp.]|nr:DUF6172 family protein [Mariprofundus sp.]